MVTHPIDLRSNHPDIQEQDFLLMDLKEHAGGWDVISLSLVVNFVPEPRDRGSFFTSAFFGPFLSTEVPNYRPDVDECLYYAERTWAALRRGMSRPFRS